MNARRDDEDVSTETVVAPSQDNDDGDDEMAQLYDSVQRFTLSQQEPPPPPQAEEEERLIYQKFLATRRGGSGSSGRVDRSKSLPSVHANGGVSYRLLGRRIHSGFGGLLDKVLEHGSDDEDGGGGGDDAFEEEEDEDEDEERERGKRPKARYVSVCPRPSACPPGHLSATPTADFFVSLSNLSVGNPVVADTLASIARARPLEGVRPRP